MTQKTISILLLLFTFSFQLLFSQVFTVSGTRLLDANGNEFIIRGTNNPHIWFPGRSYKALEEISETKVNCLRIVWQKKGKPSKLEKIIKRCIDLDIIPMIELHDATGNDRAEKLMELVNYYIQDEVKRIILENEKYILINIANEWGSHNMTGEYWSESYKKAIEILRSNGIKTTIVVDAPGWGQNIQPIIDYGNELLEYDPENNLLFDIHMYGSWNDSTMIKTKLKEAYQKNLPLVVGEFGYNYDSGNNNLSCAVNHRTIIRTCQELGYGYMPWSWTGNNKENAWLDLTSFKDWKTFTWWGKEVFEGEDGIIQTSEKSSVFVEE